APRDLPSFPTRRSSDLELERSCRRRRQCVRRHVRARSGLRVLHAADDHEPLTTRWSIRANGRLRTEPPFAFTPPSVAASFFRVRSEEHTSELQSPCNLV